MSDNSDSEGKNTFTMREDVAKYIEEQAKAEKMTTQEYVEDVLGANPYAVLEFEETTGKLSLIAWSPDPKDTVGGKPSDPKAVVDEYRNLRDNFAPVSAGIDYHKRFMLGGGLDVEIDLPLNKHQQEMRETIRKLNKKISMDYYNKGLRKLLDILVDEALTVGSAAAEITYINDEMFDFYGFKDDNGEYVGKPFVTKENVVKVKVGEIDKNVTVYTTRDLEAADWKKLGGLDRLKIIENAIDRLTPFREQESEDLRYWIADRPQYTETDRLTGKVQPTDDTGTYMHPWQIFWVSWNNRGLKMHGESIIKPVLSLARLVNTVQLAMGKGYQRWSDKKYFFVCGTEKRPWGKIASRNFLTAMANMIKNNWTGLPVPAGFDVKEIGGEVFDARNFLDYLITLIAAGMGYPKDFVFQSGRGEDMEAWTAWQNTYGYNQSKLSDAIENQLWEKQIWCTFGQSYRIPKQGVPARKREREDAYIPKVQWRSETKWHMADRLKMDAQILNVANPVGPQLKLAVERDIASTLGLVDVIFPTPEELEKKLSDDDKIEKQKVENQKLNLEIEKRKLEILGKDEKAIKALALSGAIKIQNKNKEKEEETTLNEGEDEEDEENPKRPLPKPIKRLTGGVSRTNEPTEDETKRGIAKPQGSTRYPKKGI